MSGKLGATAIVVLTTAILAGCQHGASNSQTGTEQIRESELRAYCPQPSLRDGTAYLQSYERGGQDDPNRLVYQAVISDTTRTCQFNEGSGTVNVVASGRIIPGPKGRAGTITLPIRVAAMRGSQVLYSQLIRHQVAVSDTAGATQFFLSDPNVVIPGGIDRSVQIVVGFDEGSQR
jgi:hypothetical protein